MSLMATDSGGEGFEPLAPGTYTARCVSVIDLGVQETGFGPKEKVYIGFEIPDERVKWTDKEGVEHEGPAFIGSRYTLSINAQSILGQHLTSWRGVPFTDEERKGFNVISVLGAPCLISVVHSDSGAKTYANIQSIMRLPKGMQSKPAESELIAYTPLDNEHAQNFDKLGEKMKQTVRAGYKMAEGSTVIGSALAVQNQVGGQPAPGEPPPAPAGDPGPSDDWDDDIPF